MYNPFKKKNEDEFAMNDMELPSLGEDSNSFPQNNSNNSTNNNSDSTMNFPQIPNLDNKEDYNPLDMQNMQNPEQSLENTPGIGGMQEMNSTPSFETPQNNFTDNNSIPTMSSGNNYKDNGNSSSQELHNEISKTKLDSLGSKMELLEHRVQNIDNKLDLILRLIQAEVSTETKMKVNMDEKMSQFR